MKRRLIQLSIVLKLVALPNEDRRQLVGLPAHNDPAPYLIALALVTAEFIETAP